MPTWISVALPYIIAALMLAGAVTILAVQRAERKGPRDVPPCPEWPYHPDTTPSRFKPKVKRVQVLPAEESNHG